MRLRPLPRGFSRDDVATILGTYIDSGILQSDPFQTIDREGVGRMIQICAKEGREGSEEMSTNGTSSGHEDTAGNGTATKTTTKRKPLKIGVCGEHGGDPLSIHFFDACGLDYVSCSPFRVIVARLAAAQAAVEASGLAERF